MSKKTVGLISVNPKVAGLCDEIRKLENEGKAFMEECKERAQKEAKEKYIEPRNAKFQELTKELKDIGMLPPEFHDEDDSFGFNWREGHIYIEDNGKKKKRKGREIEVEMPEDLNRALAEALASMITD